ncbi:MAG TPA: nuclear transport factor 2 family protein [Chitinophagaceae bacterium]|nr:nuclear transport factor 2 family protein [Chitinophagaceae bacterium]
MTTEEQQKEIVEKTQITDLVIRYFAALDDKRLDMDIVKATFTSEAKIIRPDDSEIVGPENILDGHLKSFARFKASHHVITNFIVDISTDTATLRSNVIANHLWADNENNPSLNNKYFLADGVLSAKAIKVNDHWRISELKNRVIWRTGDGMKEILNFGRSTD